MTGLAATFAKAAAAILMLWLVAAVGLQLALAVILTLLLAGIAGLLWLIAREVLRTGPWPRPRRYILAPRWRP